MKRLFMMAAVALCMSATAFAGNKSDAKDWAINVNMSKLSDYLALSANQYEDVDNITSFFSDKMDRAAYAKDAKKQQRLREAVYGNFSLMKRTLNDEQYKKYVYLVNVTLRNKGLYSIIEGMPQE